MLNTTEQTKERIRNLALKAGFAQVRFADLKIEDAGEKLQAWIEAGFHGEMAWMERTLAVRKDPTEFFPGAKSCLLLMATYDGEVRTWRKGEPLGDMLQRSDPFEPWISAYATRRDYHKVMATALRKLAADLEREFSCRARISLDVQPVMEKAVARGRIGWQAKNTNIIHPRFGSYFFLGLILTDLEIAPDEGATPDRCGSCTRCLDVCPTGAFVSPYVLDASKCIAYLTIEHRGVIARKLRPKMGTWIFGCDLCQMVCPWNRQLPAVSLPGLKKSDLFDGLDLRGLASLSEEAFKKRFAGTPVMRAKRDGFLRNVAIALGNAGREEAVEPLEGLLSDSSWLVRLHAAWALGRLGSQRATQSLRRRLGVEVDARVRRELTDALKDHVPDSA